MFEVSIFDDRTLDVRGVSTYKVGDKIYSEQLEIMPKSGNVIGIRAQGIT